MLVTLGIVVHTVQECMHTRVDEHRLSGFARASLPAYSTFLVV